MILGIIPQEKESDVKTVKEGEAEKDKLTEASSCGVSCGVSVKAEAGVLEMPSVGEAGGEVGDHSIPLLQLVCQLFR